MISWIQRTFQHHFRVVFSVMLVVIIISFVFIYSPSSGLGGSDATVTAQKQQYFDLNLASAADQQKLLNDALLSINLQVGTTAGMDSEQLQRYALSRYAALQLAAELHVPNPSAAELTDHLKSLPIFAGADGTFDAARYSTFRLSIKSGANGVSEGAVTRVLNDDWRAGVVQRLLGGPGYVQTGEIETQLKYADTQWTIAYAAADYAAFNPTITPTEAALTKFFEDNLFRYEVPPQVRVSYAEFPATAYLAQVTLTDDEVQSFYNANPGRFPKPAAPAAAPVLSTPPATDAAADFAAVKPQVEAALRNEKALRIATREASNLAFALYDRKVAAGESLTKFLAEQKITLKAAAPFSRNALPPEFSGSAAVAEEAFKLDAKRFSSDALALQNSAVVLFWQELLPARKPALAEVRTQVVADYTENEKRLRFVEAGRALRSQIDTRVKAGESFAAAAAAAAGPAGLSVEVKEPAQFTYRQPPADVDGAVLGAVERLEKGALSDLVSSATKGFIVQVKEKKLPDVSPANPEFAASRNQLATSMARFNADAYLEQIVTREMQKSAPPAVTP
jgi:peptidyl-prolyl cis-trans isomerase D